MRPAFRTTLRPPRIEPAGSSPLAVAPEALTAEAFAEWLGSFPTTARVGWPDDDTGCPIAYWLRARCWPQARILRGRLQVAPGAAWEDLPPVLARFERLAREEETVVLVASRARRILRQAIQEEETRNHVG